MKRLLAIPDAKVLKGIAKVLMILGAVLLLNWVVNALVRHFLPDFDKATMSNTMRGMILALALCYAALLAVPFMPGVEIGIALLGVFGPAAAPIVYVATLLGLGLAFLIGRMLPEKLCARALRRVGATEMASGLERAELLTGRLRIAALLQNSPPKAVEFLLRHRAIALGLLLNLPGNALIGGGGGIALVAGVSRLYSVPFFVLTTAIAVAPVPLMVALLGQSPFG